MTELALTELDQARPVGGGGEVTPPRSLWRQAARDAFARAGARVGLAWIAVLAVFAVFAPFIASSHPYLMKVGGRWSSPLLRHLTPADVVVLVMALAGVVLVPVRWSIPRKLLA